MKTQQNKETKACVLISEDSKKEVFAFMSISSLDSLSSHKDVCLPPDAGRVPFTQEINVTFRKKGRSN